MVYHVRVSTKSAPAIDEVRLDLSREQLEERFLRPYRLGQPIVIGGRTIAPDDLDRLEITESDETSDQLLPKVRQRLRQEGSLALRISDESHVVDEGVSRTDDFIVGAPGYGLAAEQAAAPSPGGVMPAPADPKSVFVVHGRNAAARDAMFTFLRSIGLHPMEWAEAVQATGRPSPYTGEILTAAFERAQAIVVLFTPDDLAYLQPHLQHPGDPAHETTPTGQARPNVIFEAGLAMGRDEGRTVLVELGTVRPFSDVAGRHVIRINDGTERRQELAQRLQAAGCAVNLTGTDWHRAGGFDVSLTTGSSKGGAR